MTDCISAQPKGMLRPQPHERAPVYSVTSGSEAC
jgi:hypothetical protein